MTEITQIDTKKYIVVKADDLKYLNRDEANRFLRDVEIIESGRKLANKQNNMYLVLNTSDKISLQDLEQAVFDLKVKRTIDQLQTDLKLANPNIEDISLGIVNAILKAQR